MDRGDALAPYDAVLLLSFGGPEGPDEVVPFLESVTDGRGIPPERLAEVRRHYDDRGGRSPINDESRALAAALAAELDRRGLGRPVLWGNRHLRPSMADALRQAREVGAASLVTVLTSAYPSYAGCRAYREQLAAALAELDAEGYRPRVDKIRPYAVHPGFSATNAHLTIRAVRELLATSGLPAPDLRLVFVTHSLPVTQDAASGPSSSGGGAYRAWHEALAAAITEEVAITLGTQVASALAYCSRSGPPRQAWLEPDISDHLEDLAHQGVRGVVVVPIGFVADHLEVVYDLDELARTAARRLGLAFVRVPTVRVDPAFVSGLTDLLVERAAQARGETPVRPAWPLAQPELGPTCAVGCCANPAGPRPAVAEESGGDGP